MNLKTKNILLMKCKKWEEKRIVEGEYTKYIIINSLLQSVPLVNKRKKREGNNLSTMKSLELSVKLFYVSLQHLPLGFDVSLHLEPLFLLLPICPQTLIQHSLKVLSLLLDNRETILTSLHPWGFLLKFLLLKLVLLLQVSKHQTCSFHAPSQCRQSSKSFILSSHGNIQLLTSDLNLCSETGQSLSHLLPEQGNGTQTVKVFQTF